MNEANTMTTDISAEQAAAPGVKAMRRSVNHIFLWLLIYNFVTFLAAFLLTPLQVFSDEYVLTAVCAAAGTVLVYLCTFKKWPFRPFAGGARKMTVRDFFTVFGAFGITQLITLGVGLITDAMGIEGTSIDMGPMTVGLVLYAVLLGPAVEELLYRGFAIGNGRILGKIPSIVAAALAFGLMHGNLSQFIIGFLGGLVLGFVFEEYSIWWSLLIHIINNAFGVVTMAVPPETGDIVAIIFYGILGVAAVYAVIRLIRCRSKVKEWLVNPENHGPAGVVRSVLTSPWFIIFVLLYVAMIVLLMIFPEFASSSLTAGQP